MLSDDYKIGWLEAMFEGEGSVSTYTRKYESEHGRGESTRVSLVVLNNTDPELIDQCKQYLREIGFKPLYWKGSNGPGRKDVMRVFLYDKVEIQRLLDLFKGGATKVRKAQRLLDENPLVGCWKSSLTPEDMAYLFSLGNTQAAIAEMAGIHQATVHVHLSNQGCSGRSPRRGHVV